MGSWRRGTARAGTFPATLALIVRCPLGLSAKQFVVQKCRAAMGSHGLAQYFGLGMAFGCKPFLVFVAEWLGYR